MDTVKETTLIFYKPKSPGKEISILQHRDVEPNCNKNLPHSLTCQHT